MRTLFSILCAFFLTPTLLSAQGSCSITVTTVSGTAKTTNTSLAVGASLAKGDTIYVGSGSLLELKVGAGAITKIGANSKVYVDASYCPDASTHAIRLKLVSGNLWAKGHSGVEKFQITSEHFLVMVGNSTISANARYLDTSFTLSRRSERIETRDWADTVEVESYTFPFVGHTATIFALAGEPVLVPWGGTGAILQAGMQSTFGFDEAHISSKPQKIEQSQILFTKEGDYRKGS
ncbi:MAG: hypothetical protein KDD67_00885 [Ignavibacteriae bacterium]|nr:hypothetical protein [Ignavibacteriota bacterium]MCB9215351.1 hypothetical protein [Ignavibacteria bacterium]